MVSMKIIFAAASASVLLSGCVGDPRQYESEPVQLNTPNGIVVCQLYTRERVLWDRAIDRPTNMTVREADDICRAEGLRQKNAS